MHDWIADWRKWSRSERVLALLVTVLVIALPLGSMLSATVGV